MTCWSILTDSLLDLSETPTSWSYMRMMRRMRYAASKGIPSIYE